MIIEKEIKVLEIEPDALHQQLMGHGASIKFAGNITDYFFDYSDQSLAKQKKRIRMRKQGMQRFLTCKERHAHDRLKVATEYEYALEDHEATRALLLSYGLVCYHQEEKTRTEYSYEGVCFAVDTYPWAPSFLEIECVNTKTIYQWIKRLWLQKKPLLTCGREWLFRYYQGITKDLAV